MREGTSTARWIALVVVCALLAVCFRDAIASMVEIWFERPEYSHGVLIPVIAVFLIWQRSDQLAGVPLSGTWWGVTLVAAGIALHAVGVLAAVFVVQQYGALLAFYGLVLAFIGGPAARVLWMPLTFLLLMIPLPDFLLSNLSSKLQLVSSAIGVWVIRMFGISVHLEGNVIDLGSYHLQVAEACDGLRYLFPLMTLGFIMACFYRAATWKRVCLFLSSIPIAVLMNSLRIGTIGVMVEHWGVGMAEGFLHEFQGWLVFMASAALMVLEIVLLSRPWESGQSWRELFAIDWPSRGAPGAAWRRLTVSHTATAAAAALLLYAAAGSLLPQRAESIPLRRSLVDFPGRLGAWDGRKDALEPVYLRALKLNDYLLTDFTRAAEPAVNLYVAWYDSQRAGQSVHSPRSCVPGGGWRINEFTQVTLADAGSSAGALRVNRALISYGDQRQLVYYWFQQRGRVITSEYLVKWYLLHDALTHNRTDGALVRLTTPVAPGEPVRSADARLADFAALAVPRLGEFIPE